MRRQTCRFACLAPTKFQLALSHCARSAVSLKSQVLGNSIYGINECAKRADAGTNDRDDGEYIVEIDSIHFIIPRSENISATL